MISDHTVTTGEYRRKAFADLCILASLPEEKRRIWETQFDSNKVLSAMLNHAPTDRGTRYVSCAILSCTKQLDLWIGLAWDWLKFLLLPFKTSHKEKLEPLSLSSTPTISSPAANVSVVPTQRPSDFETQLRRRQGGVCAVIDIRGEQGKFIGAHIVRRSIAKADDSNAGIASARTVTWDILRHYVDLSEEFIASLSTTIDSPGNGVLLEMALHASFDDYEWCFVPTEDPGVYTVKWFTEPSYLFEVAGRSQIKFESKYSTPIELPHTKFLTIHRAVAEVLHESGVGEYLNLFMDTFSTRNSPFCPEKLEGQELALRLSLLPLAAHL